jgi:hypothetical protein
VISTGGSWDPTDRRLYFLAGDLNDIRAAFRIHPCLLLAVNEIPVRDNLASLTEILDSGVQVLLDSGVFWLAQRHARKHDLDLYSTLALPPEELDGWDKLLDRYRTILHTFGDRLWGYVELDQGGRDRKRATRRMLEAEGLHPIPVYHPLSDGPAYFHELAQGYDRICAANLVNTRSRTRRVPLLASLAELKTSYPHLWVHLLGVSPDESFYAMDAGDSGDSSTWVGCLRFRDGYREQAAGRLFSRMPTHFKYPLGSGHKGELYSRQRAVQMAACGQVARQANWRLHRGRLGDLGLLDPAAALPAKSLAELDLTQGPV